MLKKITVLERTSTEARVEISPPAARNRTVSWSTSNPGVVMLSGLGTANGHTVGMIHAESPGVATISATVRNFIEDENDKITGPVGVPERLTDYYEVTVENPFITEINNYIKKIKFNDNSDIKEAKIMQGTVYTIGANITIEEYRWMIAIMDNESDNPAEWLALASALLNNYEGYNSSSLYATIEDQCHKHVLGRNMGSGVVYSAEERKTHIANYRDGTGTFLVHKSRENKMKEILNWILEGNRVFAPEIRHWAAGNGYNLYSTTWK